MRIVSIKRSFTFAQQTTSNHYSLSEQRGRRGAKQFTIYKVRQSTVHWTGILLAQMLWLKDNSIYNEGKTFIHFEFRLRNEHSLGGYKLESRPRLRWYQDSWDFKVVETVATVATVETVKTSMFELLLFAISKWSLKPIRV